MCGRFALSDTQQLSLRFEVEPGDERALTPRYNVAPSQLIPVIVEQPEGRELRMMRWGFRPAWKRDARSTPEPINARAESLLDRPMFRPALARKRCLIPADGFYEWQERPGSKLKQPYFIRMKDKGLFAFAGLFADTADDRGSPQQTCVIITTSPNDLMAAIHNRMPAILARSGEQAWLDPELNEPEAVLSLLQPYDGEQMEAYPVSTAVSSPRSDGPELIETIA